MMIKNAVGRSSWIIVGDFNVIRFPQEKWGNEGFSCYEKEFVECIQNLGVDDLSYSGCFHTWTNNQSGSDFVSKKLDRVLSNCEWLNQFGNTSVEFLERGVSDHSPALVTISSVTSYGPKPFKFFDYWAEHNNFLDWIGDAWRVEVEGYSMFCFYSKLKAVRDVLKVKNIEVFGNLGLKISQARHELAKAQNSFISSKGNAECQRKEKECLHLLISLMAAEENFLKQKSRVKWLNLGDGNNAFFHNAVKVRNSTNLIKMLKDAEGNSIHDMHEIKRMAISFYQNLLGHSSHNFSSDKADRVAGLIDKRFCDSCVAGMCAPVTRSEIQRVIFSMNPSKAPRPDGFTARFFQKTWPMIGDDFCDAILEFFVTGKLLREVNSTNLTLIPKKKKNASIMGDYRPIACCNLVYKCITKILANRLVPGLDEVISSNQGAFIPKRSIAENILLAQEVVCDYHKEKGTPRCTLKVDLMKAYDSVDWEYILHCLYCFGAPARFVAWI
jgi:hypothetical protein